MYERVIKRGLDIAISAFILLACSPVIVLVAICILLDDGWPFLFRQQRVGRARKQFTIFKFRSMPQNTGNIASSEATKVKITRLGGFIRRTNLDELPQFFNILRGDMSLVGPRPALGSQASLVEARDAAKVYEIRPGLTGLAQVNSYDNMPEEEKVRWDAAYRESLSFVNDIKILFRTFGYLLKPPPVY